MSHRARGKLKGTAEAYLGLKQDHFIREDQKGKWGERFSTRHSRFWNPGRVFVICRYDLGNTCSLNHKLLTTKHAPHSALKTRAAMWHIRGEWLRAEYKIRRLPWITWEYPLQSHNSLNGEDWDGRARLMDGQTDSLEGWHCGTAGKATT